MRASAVLKSVRQRICLQLVFASASHLLGLIDARAGNSGEAAITGAVAKERAAIDKAEAYYHEAADGQAQMAYFGGMAMVTAVLTLSRPYLALFVGDAGRSADRQVPSARSSASCNASTAASSSSKPTSAEVPVLPRRAASADRRCVRDGDLVRLHRWTAPPARRRGRRAPPHRRLALLVLGFFAGFSERWAQDTLTSIVPAAKPAPEPPSAH